MSESSLPPHTRAFLYKAGSWSLPGYEDLPCEGARFHSPRPLFTNDVRLVLPQWWEGTEEPHAYGFAPRATLCGTCAANLNILLQMLYATDGELDWAIRREFGNDLRALALKGWQWFTQYRPDRPVEVSEPATKG